MSKIIATLVASLFAASAFAQAGGVPPAQAPAGTNTKIEKKVDAMASDKPMTEKQEARAAKSKARKAKRAAKVGDKPLN